MNAMEYNKVSCREDKWYCCMKEMYHFCVTDNCNIYKKKIVKIEVIKSGISQ